MLLLCPLLLCLALPGCRIGGTRDYHTEADRLRRENLHLSRQVEQLEDEIHRRRDQLHALQADREPDAAMPDVERPQLASLRFGRHSGFLPRRDDDQPHRIRIYLQTLDQHGRMLPVAGKARLRVMSVPGGDEQPTVLAERTYAPEAFHQAYRSGLGGTHFTLDIELEHPLEPGDEIALRLDFTNAATGAQFTRRELFGR